MLRNIPLVAAGLFDTNVLNEVLSLNAQESHARPPGALAIRSSMKF